MVAIIKPERLVEAAIELKLPRRSTFIREGAPQPITDLLKGKTVERFLTTGTHLLIRFTDRTEARISWREWGGRATIGKPQLDEMGPHQ